MATQQLPFRSAYKSSIDFDKRQSEKAFVVLYANISQSGSESRSTSTECFSSDFDWFFFTFIPWWPHKAEICNGSPMMHSASWPRKQTPQYPELSYRVVITARPPFMQQGRGFLWAFLPYGGSFSLKSSKKEAVKLMNTKVQMTLLLPWVKCI